MRLRRLIQALFLALFFLLFLTASYALVGLFPHDLFLRADPLAAILTLILVPAGAAVFLPALAVAVSALLMGRAFCGYACPLGTLLDTGARLATARHELPGWLHRLWELKYGILLLVLASGALGLSLLSWVDPIVLLTRTTAVLLEPWILAGGSLGLEALRPLASRLDWVGLANATLPSPLYWLTGLSGALIGIIVGVSLWRSRLWCRLLCPLGALLGLLGTWAPLRRRVDEDCVDCGACARACPMGVVGEDPRTARHVDCLRCRRCAEACPAGAIHFLPMGQLQDLAPAKGPALSRRGLLAAGALGLLAGATTRVDAGKAGPRDRLIRPPGALPEEEYLDKCLRCGLCMGACVSHTLQPSLWQAGLEGIWTPRLDLRLAPCEKHCNVCGQVCPTRAIRPLPLQERLYAKIGTAVLLRERCLVWEQDKTCLVCDEICPYDAIEFREVEGRRRPFVTESRCNGCGYCEHKCPVQGESAIIVARMGELRLASGSYVAEARQRGFVFEGSREETLSVSPESPPGEKLPPGFIPDKQ